MLLCYVISVYPTTLKQEETLLCVSLLCKQNGKEWPLISGTPFHSFLSLSISFTYTLLYLLSSLSPQHPSSLHFLGWKMPVFLSALGILLGAPGHLAWPDPQKRTEARRRGKLKANAPVLFSLSLISNVPVKPAPSITSVTYNRQSPPSFADKLWALRVWFIWVASKATTDDVLVDVWGSLHSEVFKGA